MRGDDKEMLQEKKGKKVGKRTFLLLEVFLFPFSGKRPEEAARYPLTRYRRGKRNSGMARGNVLSVFTVSWSE